MKSKTLITVVLLAATNFAWAQGGLRIDNVEQHMNANNWDKTNGDRTEIVTQGPIDKFNVVVPARDSNLVDTNKSKHSYGGHS